MTITTKCASPRPINCTSSVVALLQRMRFSHEKQDSTLSAGPQSPAQTLQKILPGLNELHRLWLLYSHVSSTVAGPCCQSCRVPLHMPPPPTLPASPTHWQPLLPHSRVQICLLPSLMLPHACSSSPGTAAAILVCLTSCLITTPLCIYRKSHKGSSIRCWQHHPKTLCRAYGLCLVPTGIAVMERWQMNHIHHQSP